MALFPPNSNIVFPNLNDTYSLTLLPIFVLPVKLIRLTFFSFTINSPTSEPLATIATRTPFGTLCLLKTSYKILAVAIVTRGVFSLPFHITQFPQTNAKHAFHPNTAWGKLNDVITPIIPIGFQVSRII